MYVCMYVCVCVYIYIYIYIQANAYTCAHTYTLKVLPHSTGGEDFQKDQNIRTKRDLDALGAVGDLGWYTVRAALWAFQVWIVTCFCLMQRLHETGKGDRQLDVRSSQETRATPATLKTHSRYSPSVRVNQHTMIVNSHACLWLP